MIACKKFMNFVECYVRIMENYMKLWKIIGNYENLLNILRIFDIYWTF
jgi:hypothetical protein